MTNEGLREAMEKTPEWATNEVAMETHYKACQELQKLKVAIEWQQAINSATFTEQLRARNALWATKEHKAYWTAWKAQDDRP